LLNIDLVRPQIESSVRKIEINGSSQTSSHTFKVG